MKRVALILTAMALLSGARRKARRPNGSILLALVSCVCLLGARAARALSSGDVTISAITPFAAIDSNNCAGGDGPHAMFLQVNVTNATAGTLARPLRDAELLARLCGGSAEPSHRFHSRSRRDDGKNGGHARRGGDTASLLVRQLPLYGLAQLHRDGERREFQRDQRNAHPGHPLGALRGCRGRRGQRPRRRRGRRRPDPEGDDQLHVRQPRRQPSGDDPTGGKRRFRLQPLPPAHCGHHRIHVHRGAADDRRQPPLLQPGSTVRAPTR